MIGFGVLRCFFLGSLMTWYTASVWQTVDRYFRDQFRVYLDKEYEENAELKKDVMMEGQRKAVMENIAKMELNKALDRQAELAEKKQPQVGRRGEIKFTEGMKEGLMVNEVEEVDVCNEEDDRGGTRGKKGRYETEFIRLEEGTDLVNKELYLTSETEVVVPGTEGAWVTTGKAGSKESEAAVGIDGTVETEIVVGEESPTGADVADESASSWETERIIAEMQNELKFETAFDVWKTGECENEASIQEECRLEDFFEVEQQEGVTRKWRNVFDEDDGEICLIDSVENRGSCSHNVDIEGEGIVIRRPFGN